MKYLFIFSLILCAYVSEAQFDHEEVFPNLEGDELFQELKANYKPDTVMSFSAAKDALYRDVYQLNDSVECVYTGFTRYLNPSEDPSQWMYQNGSSLAINAEHNYPKSKGASSGNALSDLYNLFPTRADVNASRANHPFAEIPDEQTNTWYYLDFNSSNIPDDYIDFYSELGLSTFEPREDHKGNVARSVFYFYTIYRQEAMQADPAYFEDMLETLCQWHDEDPVDSLEWHRNLVIAAYQSDKKNPFIMDCSLAGRLYCEGISENCIKTETKDNSGNSGWILYPNPTSQKLKFKYPDSISGKYQIVFYNLIGQEQFSYVFDSRGHGGYQFSIDIASELKPSYYLVSIKKLDTPNKTVFHSTILIQ